MTSTVVTPRFSSGEMNEIDRMVTLGVAKSRADLVRIATIFYIEKVKK